MPIRGELDAAGNAGRYILHELVGILGITPANDPRDHQLRVGIQSRPSPEIANASGGGFGRRDVFGLGVAEAPNLIALHALRVHADNRFVVECLTSLGQQLLTVLIDTPTTREIDRMDEPSQSMARIWMRLASGSLFIN